MQISGNITRRNVLSLTAGSLAAIGLSACAQPTPTKASTPSASTTPTNVDTLRVHVPTTLAFGAPMVMFGEQGLTTSGLVNKVDVNNWVGVDVLRSLLLNNQTDLAATPSYVSANLFNKGADLRLAAITVWGMLFVAGPAGSTANDLAQLKGKKVGVPLPNNMPDLVFRYLLTTQDMAEADLDIVSYSESQELVAAFIKGDVEWAVLPEHAMTVALAQAKSNGRQVERVIDLQQLWAKATGSKPRFPMAGVAVPTRIADNKPLLGAILTELGKSVTLVNASSEATVKEISETTEVPVPIVKQVIPRLQLEMVPAASARAELEDFYNRISTINSGIIGGKLPDAQFYLADPR